jgi:hypothetical protein
MEKVGQKRRPMADPPDWIICGFYPLGFPRQNAQKGCYTLTARFGKDHAEAIADLFGDRSRFHPYVVPSNETGVAKGSSREAWYLAWVTLS